MTIDLSLKPKKNYKLLRIGGSYDGGYLVGQDSLKKAKVLISLGIDDDWRFEKEFHIKNKKAKVYCYDDKSILNYLIKKFIIKLIFLSWKGRFNFIKCFVNIIDFIRVKKNITFFKKKIFHGELEKILKKIKKDNIFLKIDIEGSEYRILEEIIKNQVRIIGLVIEFHDFDYHKKIIYNFCKSLSLDLIHIHPNNFGHKDKNGDPTVIELTFEKNPVILNNNCNLPHKLDMRNNPYLDDINLFFKKS